MKTSLFDKILYATDMSDNAKAAAHYALSLAQDYSAYLTVVNVIPDVVEEMSAIMGYDLAAHYDKENLKSFSKDSIDENKKILIEKIHTLCDETGSRINNCMITPKVLIRIGHPVEQIMQVAKEEEPDLIIVGSRGHSMLGDLLVGSVARGVVKNCHVPVLTIPLGSD